MMQKIKDWLVKKLIISMTQTRCEPGDLVCINIPYGRFSEEHFRAMNGYLIKKHPGTSFILSNFERQIQTLKIPLANPLVDRDIQCEDRKIPPMRFKCSPKLLRELRRI